MYVGNVKAAVRRLAVCHLPVSDQEHGWKSSGLTALENNTGCKKVHRNGNMDLNSRALPIPEGTGGSSWYWGEAEGSLWLYFYHFLPLLEGKKLQEKEQHFAIKMITVLEIHLENFLWILCHRADSILILVGSSNKYMKLNKYEISTGSAGICCSGPSLRLG